MGLPGPRLRQIPERGVHRVGVVWVGGWVRGRGGAGVYDLPGLMANLSWYYGSPLVCRRAGSWFQNVRRELRFYFLSVEVSSAVCVAPR